MMSDADNLLRKDDKIIPIAAQPEENYGDM